MFVLYILITIGILLFYTLSIIEGLPFSLRSAVFFFLPVLVGFLFLKWGYWFTAFGAVVGVLIGSYLLWNTVETHSYGVFGMGLFAVVFSTLILVSIGVIVGAILDSLRKKP